jgi:dienelactone hydrolase
MQREGYPTLTDATDAERESETSETSTKGDTMKIERSGITYDVDGTTFEAHLAWDAEATAKKPAVLVLHDWAGLHEPSRTRAQKLAALGYVGFAVDLYGKGKRGTPGADNSALMNPLLGDRALLKRRLLAAVDTCAKRDEVDASRIAAIGFCFGGLCALDLARANAPGLRGAVSFHGIYPPPKLGAQEPIQSKVLVCHGWEDPFTPPDAMLGLARELTDAKADWQIHAYGHTVHAFTAEGANDRQRGTVYDAKADRRSWAAMTDFLAEALA